MKTGLYPGCSLMGSAREYRESLLAVAAAWGIKIEEVPDWNCCGATAAHNLNHDLALALPARILAGAEKAGMEELVVPCAACYNRLAMTRHELRQDAALQKRIAAVIESEFALSVEIINIVQWIEKYILPDLPARIVTHFKHKVACYYGCLLVRPPKVLDFDRPEDPQSMEAVARRIGADPIDWAFKTECCGAGFSIPRTDLVGKLSAQILEDAASRGAEAIFVACPMCHSNLDMRRKVIEKTAKKRFDLPVLYITQAIGLAAGIPAKKLGLQRHFIPLRFAPAPGAAQPQTQE